MTRAMAMARTSTATATAQPGKMLESPGAEGEAKVKALMSLNCF